MTDNKVSLFFLLVVYRWN